MPDRYKETTTKNVEPTDDKRPNSRVFATTLYPKIESDSNDIFIVSKQGDTLDILAKRFYDDVSLWWVIAHANHIGKGSRRIKPGVQLRIPKNISRIFSDLEKINREA